MLALLRKLNPEHPFFTEGFYYERPRKKKQAQIENEAKLQPYENAFDGIPLPKRRVKRPSVTAALLAKKKPTKLELL